MSNVDHRPGVKEINLVNRRLRLEGITEKNKAVIVSEIDALLGIEHVSFDEPTETLLSLIHI